MLYELSLLVILASGRSTSSLSDHRSGHSGKVDGGGGGGHSNRIANLEHFLIWPKVHLCISKRRGVVFNLALQTFAGEKHTR